MLVLHLHTTVKKRQPPSADKTYTQQGYKRNWWNTWNTDDSSGGGNNDGSGGKRARSDDNKTTAAVPGMPAINMTAADAETAGNGLVADVTTSGTKAYNLASTFEFTAADLTTGDQVPAYKRALGLAINGPDPQDKAKGRIGLLSLAAIKANRTISQDKLLQDAQAPDPPANFTEQQKRTFGNKLVAGSEILLAVDYTCIDGWKPISSKATKWRKSNKW